MVGLKLVISILKIKNARGRSSITDEDQIKTQIENNPRYTTRKLAEMLNMLKSTIHEHFVKLGYINRFIWVSHDLTEKNLMNRIFICDLLYKCNEETLFLKWIIYNNVERKRSWGKRNEPPLATPKAGLHPFKEGHALCLVRLERDPVLWAFTKQRDKFREVLFPIRRIEDSNWTKTSRNSESEGRVSTGQFQRPHISFW